MQIIGIAGGTGSGKSTLAEALLSHFGPEAMGLSHDWYYRDQKHLDFDKRLETNYDHPNALETGLLVQHLDRLMAGESVAVPQYDYTQHIRAATTHRLSPAPILVLEGLHVLGDACLRQRMALKVYVTAPEAVRLARRIDRDTRERGRSRESVVEQFEATARPMHDVFIEPARHFADLVVSGEEDIQRLVGSVVEAMASSE